MKTCKEQFKEFERQDVKYREDFKHMKQKIKKLSDKIEKDSSKISEIEKENEESSSLIPNLEEEISKLQQLLGDEEKILEGIIESAKGETEKHQNELLKVRAELEPWENQLIEHKGKHDVACSESKFLKEKNEAGRKAFEDAQHQMNTITEKIKEKTTFENNIEIKIQENKLEASEARRLEQECIKGQESLIPLEQAARQKVAEIMSILMKPKAQNPHDEGFLEYLEDIIGTDQYV